MQYAMSAGWYFTGHGPIKYHQLQCHPHHNHHQESRSLCHAWFDNKLLWPDLDDWVQWTRKKRQSLRLPITSVIPSQSRCGAQRSLDVTLSKQKVTRAKFFASTIHKFWAPSCETRGENFNFDSCSKKLGKHTLKELLQSEINTKMKAAAGFRIFKTKELNLRIIVRCSWQILRWIDNDPPTSIMPWLHYIRQTARLRTGVIWQKNFHRFQEGRMFKCVLSTAD